MIDNLTKQKEKMAKFQEAEMLKHLDLKYKNEIIRSMEWLGEKEDTIFLGQSLKYSGNAMYNTTKTIFGLLATHKKRLLMMLFCF